MTQRQTLHIAHWGMRQSYIPLAEIISTRLQADAPFPGGLYKPVNIHSREDFKGYDLQSRARSPILVSGDIGVRPTDRTVRLSWDIPQMLAEVFQWLDSDVGEPWREGPIWVLIPAADDGDLSLLMAIQQAVVEFFEAQDRPYPENLLLDIASDNVAQRLMPVPEIADRHQIILMADSLLDTSYAALQTDLATRANSDGRILSEAVVWIAISPEPSTQFHAEFAQTPKAKDAYLPLSEHCQEWLPAHYQVGDNILLQHDLPLFNDNLFSLYNYRNYCLPPSDMPRKAPNSKRKSAIEAFEAAIDAAKPIDHQLQINALHGTLGDCGMARTLMILVITLEQMAQAQAVNAALVYQESATHAYHYLIHKDAEHHG